MPATQSIIGKGTTLGYGMPTGSTVTYTTLAEVKNVKPPKITAEKYEATHYASPSSYLEWLFGWLDGGDVDIEINYLHASASALLALIGVSQSFLITLPDTHTYTFLGAIDDYEGDLPNKGVCTLKLKVKVTGPPVYA
jgi:hypothetical protein